MVELPEKKEVVVNKVLSRGSTQKNANKGSKRKKKATRSNRKAKEKSDSEGGPHLTAPVLEESLPPVELEKEVGPNRIVRDISHEIRQKLGDPGETSTP